MEGKKGVGGGEKSEEGKTGCTRSKDSNVEENGEERDSRSVIPSAHRNRKERLDALRSPTSPPHHHPPNCTNPRLRTMHDAILIGVQTVVMDDPRLKSEPRLLYH